MVYKVPTSVPSMQLMLIKVVYYTPWKEEETEAQVNILILAKQLVHSKYRTWSEVIQDYC